MGPLVSKIQEAIESQFQAKLVSLRIEMNQDVYDIMGNQPTVPMKSFVVYMEVVESKHKAINGEYPAHSIQSLLKYGFFDHILEENGRLVSMSTNITPNDGFRSKLEFVTNDIEAFAEALTNFMWKNYSKEFDLLMEDKLSKD